MDSNTMKQIRPCPLVGTTLSRRELSTLRREYEAAGMSVSDCARRIVDVVAKFGLRPVEQLSPPEPITEDDLGVVCYQVVLPV